MNKFMNEAIKEAKKAYLADEVPIGAVIVKNGSVIASSHNLCEKNRDSTCHAEMNAIKKAMEAIGEKLLDDCDMYITVEPCAMCAGAIINSGIKRVFIGCEEAKTGCFGSVVNLSDKFSRKPEIYFGFCEDDCKKLMVNFFEQKRKHASP